MLRTRRQIVELGVFATCSSALVLLGCASAQTQPAAPPPAPSTDDTKPKETAAPASVLTAEELAVLDLPPGPLPIVQRSPGDTGVLRHRARELGEGDLAKLSLLEKRMRETLASTGRGVGIAGPQVAIGVRAILVMLDARSDHPRVQLFVNPRIVERSDEVTADYEGCLSVPDVCGLVKRSRRIVVEHGVAGLATERLEVSDFDARIFQHEIDHLEGVLYIDRVDGEVQPKDRLPELREKLRQEQPKIACTPVFYGVRRDEILL